jgi:uncharacterized delta-60 repeat protein
MMQPLSALAARAAHLLRRALPDCAPLLLALLLPWAGQAQAPTVTVTPAGPLILCAGSTQTLTATAAANVPGFNVGGSGSNGPVLALAVQPDGKVLVGGDFTTYNGTAAPRSLLRLNPDGTLDATFNSGGAGANSTVYALAVQADGKIVVGGTFTAYNGSAAAPDYLLRLNADGSLDTGFNNGGTGINNPVYVLTVQAAGKVLVGGFFTAYNGSAAAPDNLLRLNADGTLDPGFNNGGAGTDGIVNTVAVQPDGKVLVGGGFRTYNGSAAAPDFLLRLNADGTLDPGFNNGGAGANTTVNTVAVQADGKVLVGGLFTAYNGNAAALDFLLRLNADGTLDTGFNNGGAGVNGLVLTLVVQADGKVLVGGNFQTYNGNAAAPDYLLRLNADGTLDTGFNNGPTAGANVNVSVVAVQADGKVLAGGYFQSYNGSAAAPDYVLRLNANGSLNNAATVPAGLAYTWSNGATGPSITVSQPGDYRATATTTTGTGYSNVVRVNAPPAVSVSLTPAGPLALATGGSATLTATATLAAFNAASNGFDSPVYAVAVQPDGKVLVGGAFAAYNGSATAPDALLRLNPDGTLDATFNAGGTGANGYVYAVAVQPDGKVLMGGNFTTYNGAAAPGRVLRLNANGSLDTGFNAGGAGASDLVSALAVQADGKVLVGGNFTTYNGSAAAPDYLLRLNANGSLDTAFNPGGTGANGSVNALVVLADGKVLVGGAFATYNGSATAPDYVLRLNADGLLDASFNPGGVGASSSVSVLAVQPDGKVLVGGGFNAYNGSFVAPDCVLRLSADGTLDASFNAGGVGASSVVFALAVQPDGKVLVGGFFTRYNDNTAISRRMLRLNANGSLDAGFNPNGVGASSTVYAVVLQADGKVLVGGDLTAYNGNFATTNYLLRLNPDGGLNNVATALPGATFAFSPGPTSGPTRTVSTAGTYTATATDPATGCTYTSNAVVVTVGLATAALEV